MGGKSAPTNSAVVDEQKAEAAQAAQQEADRQKRIQTGLASIKGAFEGAPVMANQSSPFDWSTFAPSNGRAAASGVPAGYTAVRVPSTTGASGTAANGGSGAITATRADGAPFYSGGDPGTITARRADGTPFYSGGAGAGGFTWGLQDASGKITKQGDPLSITSQVDTGQKTGGFDTPFYDKYKQSVLDYYMPQVQDQYKDARDELTYRLGRAGTLTSSAANDQVAKLAKQNSINEAGVYNQADTAAGDLRTQVAGEESKAVSQLYATEDPDVAANQATDAVRNISLEQPALSPLSSLFNIATIGGANVLKGYQNNQALNALNAPLPTKTGASRVVGA